MSVVIRLDKPADHGAAEAFESGFPRVPGDVYPVRIVSRKCWGTRRPELHFQSDT